MTCIGIRIHKSSEFLGRMRTLYWLLHIRLLKSDEGFGSGKKYDSNTICKNPMQMDLVQYTFELITMWIRAVVHVIKHLENGVLSYSSWKLFIPLDGANVFTTPDYLDILSRKNCLSMYQIFMNVRHALGNLLI